MNFILISIQVVVALGLVNVWLLRNKQATAYRGGRAKTLKEEFLAYGLPEWFYFLIGGLKILAALALLAGIMEPALVPPAAALLTLLMLGALSMHIKVKDPFTKSVPALCMLILNLGILALALS